MSRMSRRRSQPTPPQSWWEESSSNPASPRIRKRDVWMERIVGKLEKFQVEPEPPAPKPILVLDRSVAEHHTFIEQAPVYKPTTSNGKQDIFASALAQRMKANKERKKNDLEEIKRDLKRVMKKKEEERQKALKAERELIRRLNNGVDARERDEDDDVGGAGLIPLELLPVHHPSHGSFRGLHPMYGNSQVRGFIPPTPRSNATASDFMTRGPFLGNVQLSQPPSAFQDANHQHWNKNATPMRRDSLGALPSRGTYTARHDGKKKRQRYAQILLGDTEAGGALFHGQSLPQLQETQTFYGPPPSSALTSLTSFSYDDRNSRGMMSRRQSRPPPQSQQSQYSQPPASPITQRLPLSDRVGIFDAGTGQQLVPLQAGNPVTEYLLGATDHTMRERSRQGVRLGGQRLTKDRTLSDAAHESAVLNTNIVGAGVESRVHTASSRTDKDFDQMQADLAFLKGSFGF